MVEPHGSLEESWFGLKVDVTPGVWARAVPVLVYGQPAYRLSTSDMILHLAVHAAFHVIMGASVFVQLYDIGRVVETWGGISADATTRMQGCRLLHGGYDTVSAGPHSERGIVPSGPIRVLFLCTGNSARSQIAEALLRASGGPDFEVTSAGTEPHGVNPYTIRVLAEVGIDWSAARSKAVTEFIGRPFDYVVTVCDRARQACPFLPGRHRQLHWDLEDPAEAEGADAEKLEAFRRTRALLDAHLAEFVELARRARP